MSAVYNGLASFGKVVNEIKFGIIAFFAVLMIILSVFLFVKKPQKNQPSTKPAAGMFLAGGIFMLLTGGFGYYLTQKYKPVAAVSGAADVFGIANGLLHR